MRSRATFVELLCGCLMIFPEGWMTRAISAITKGCHWTAYYKLMDRGLVGTLRLARALFEMVNDALPMETLNLVIDNTLISRQSEKASGSARRKYVLPIVSRSVPVTGNRNKLTIALALVRILAPVMMNKPVQLLFNAWLMRARLILRLLSRKTPIMVRYRIVLAAKRSSQTWTQTPQNLRDQNDAMARSSWFVCAP